LGTDLGEKSYRDTKLINDGGAFEALKEGAIQARDTILPSLVVCNNVDDWLKESPWKTDKCHGGIRREYTPVLCVLDNVLPEGSLFNISRSDRPLVLAIGPERGWSDRERGLFEQAGFLRLSMGNRALRTETACTAAAALAMEKIEE